MMRNSLMAAAILALVTGGFLAGRFTAPAGPQPAGRLGNRTITLDEVDAAWREVDPSQYSSAMQGLYEGRQGAFDRIVAGTLIEQAAGRANTTPEKYVAAELSRRRRPVTETDIASFHEANKASLGPLAEQRQAIRQHLEREETSRAQGELVAELKKSAPPIIAHLTPPRVRVDVSGDDVSTGPKDAPVTVVEFSDYQCPYCARLAPSIRKLSTAYGNRVRVVWKDFPLTQIHPQAFSAAQAAHCAGEQGKYWEYHDKLFANQKALGAGMFVASAQDMGLDAARFNDCLASARNAGKVQKGLDSGARLGVNSTPTTFVNGRMIAGAVPYETLAAMVDEELRR